MPDFRIQTEQAPSSAPVAVRVIRDVGEWERLEAPWRALFDASPTAAPPLSWEWLREWWRIYGPVYGGPDGLRIVTVWRGPHLLGALPLYVGRPFSSPLGVRRLRFLSTGEAEFEETCAQYLDLLHLPGEAEACAAAIQSALLGSEGRGWDELAFDALRENSPLLAWHGRFGEGMGEDSLGTRGDCAICSLHEGFDSYLQRLNPRTRHEARRLLRSVQRAGIGLEFAGDLPSVDRFFEQLVALHQRRWTAAGRPGCFAAPRFAQFHRHLAQLLVPHGKAVLARLTQAGRPLAVIYGYRTGAKLDSYLSGVERGGIEGVPSVGTAAHLVLMAHLAERGIREYDLLLSSPSSYKTRLGKDHQRLVTFRIQRSNLRTAVQKGLGWLYDLLHKGQSYLARRAGSRQRRQGYSGGIGTAG